MQFCTCADAMPCVAQATAPLLEEDSSLWCVSSWNDNGLAALDWRPDRLVSTCSPALLCTQGQRLICRV